MGSIPKSIVEFASRKQPIALLSVRNFMDKKYQNTSRSTNKSYDYDTLFQGFYFFVIIIFIYYEISLIFS